jgi:hypothetical protein
MKSRKLVLTASALLWCVNIGVSGQNSSTATAPSIAISQPDPTPRTIVGCLVQGLPNTAGDRAAAKTTVASEDYFVRTPTVQVPPGTTVAVGAPGTTSTATSVGTAVADSFYRIAGLNVEQLRPHVGQRVEIQGHLTDNTPGTEKRRVTLTQDKDGRVKMTVENEIEVAGVLHATTIKMVSASCDK